MAGSLLMAKKMSKSKGNVIDPIPLLQEFGSDAIRYYLLNDIQLGQDGNFSRDRLIGRINSDLSNDLEISCTERFPWLRNTEAAS